MLNLVNVWVLAEIVEFKTIDLDCAKIFYGGPDVIIKLVQNGIVLCRKSVKLILFCNLDNTVDTFEVLVCIQLCHVVKLKLWIILITDLGRVVIFLGSGFLGGRLLHWGLCFLRRCQFFLFLSFVSIPIR